MRVLISMDRISIAHARAAKAPTTTIGNGRQDLSPIAPRPMPDSRPRSRIPAPKAPPISAQLVRAMPTAAGPSILEACREDTASEKILDCIIP